MIKAISGWIKKNLLAERAHVETAASLTPETLAKAFREFHYQGTAEEIRSYENQRWLCFREMTAVWPEQGVEAPGFKAWGNLVLESITRFNEGPIQHERARVFSYHDIFLQVESLRIVIRLFARDGRAGERSLAAALAEAFASSRVALVAQGQLELAAGNTDAAIAVIKKALSIETGCTCAQKVLFLAYKEKRKLDAGFQQSEMNLDDLSDRFCSRPFDTLATIDHGGKGIAFLCPCGGWLPYSAGDILAAQDADSVWNSPVARELRRSILDGDFSYCSRTLCPEITGRKLPLKKDISDPAMRRYIDDKTTHLTEGPRAVQLSHDGSCNLSCPSCRKDFIMANSEQNKRNEDIRERVILPLLSRVQGSVQITGWGDPFASRHYRSIIERLTRKDFPGLTLNLVSNGLLLNEKQWNAMVGAREMLAGVSISVDAATAETYEIVRRPGRWDVLYPNLQFIGEQRRAGKLLLYSLNFVVQKRNFREMPAFVRLAMQLGADKVMFQKYWNFGGQTQAEFTDANVGSPSHPEHEALLTVLRDPLMAHPIVESSNLKSLFESA